MIALETQRSRDCLALFHSGRSLFLFFDCFQRVKGFWLSKRRLALGVEVRKRLVERAKRYSLGDILADNIRDRRQVREGRVQASGPSIGCKWIMWSLPCQRSQISVQSLLFFLLLLSLAVAFDNDLSLAHRYRQRLPLLFVLLNVIFREELLKPGSWEVIF